MSDNDLFSLAERVENATGPDREIDDAIRKLIGQPAVPDDRYPLPPFTVSIDAALTLVPEGVRETHIVSFASDEGPLGAAWIEGAAYFERGDAKTPALALVAAALRARAADTPSVKP